MNKIMKSKRVQRPSTPPLWALLMGMLLTLPVAAAPLLTGVQARQIGGSEVELKLQLSGALTGKINSFMLENPPRLSIDMSDTGLAVAHRNQELNIGVVNSVRLLEAGGRTRLVIRLNQSAPYEITPEGSSVLIRFNRQGGSVATPNPTAVPNSSAAANPPPSVAAVETARFSLDKIDFRRGAAGEGKIIVALSHPAIVTDIRKEGSGVVIDFLSTELDRSLQKRLDVVDFATPVATIDTIKTERGARMTITPVSDLYDYLAYQTGNDYQIELKPLSTAEAEEQKKDKFGYSGEKLSLNFQNIEVRAVLQLIADFTGLNIVASDTVNGSITLRLKNVPWDQALDIILRTRSLGKRQTGNVILIAPNEELSKSEQTELEAQQKLVELAPLQTRFFQINYAKASEISALLRKDEKQSILSVRGQVTVDERTNTLMILDTSDKLEEIAGIIKKLDIAVRQVMIESRIVIANESYGKEIGVNFGAPTVGSNAGNFSTFNVNLPVGTPAGALKLNILDSNYLIDMELSAMQNEGRGETLANPKVITANQQEASIESGLDIPFEKAGQGANTASTIEFKKAAISLKVTPQITPDDSIVMQLLVTKDSLAGYAQDGKTPIIDTKKINTKVLVKNGETVVLGGVFESGNAYGEKKVPLLGDVPVLGRLFKYDNNANSKNELLIFVTPKILKDQIRTEL